MGRLAGVAEDAHEALIHKSLFKRVQAKIEERRRSKPGAAYRTHTRRNADRYLLSGLVYCARCGGKMHGGNLVAKGHSYPKYVCSTYCRNGKNNPHGCGCHGMHQDQLVDVLVRKLQETVLTTANLNRLRKALRRQIERRRTTNSEGADALPKQLNELNLEIGRAAENFLRAPAEILDVVAEKLTVLKRRRVHLQKEPRMGSTTSERPTDTNAEVEAVVSRLWRLRKDLAKADPARCREVFRLLVSRIDLHFDNVQRGKRTDCPFRSGEIHLRTGDGSIFGSANRGEQFFRLYDQTIEAILATLPPKRKLVFPWPFTHHRSLYGRYKTILRRAGLPFTKRDMFHKIRRTTASHIARLVGQALASQHLGHQNPDSIKRYMDPRFTANHQAAQWMPRPGWDNPRDIQVEVTASRETPQPLEPVTVRFTQAELRGEGDDVMARLVNKRLFEVQDIRDLIDAVGMEDQEFAKAIKLSPSWLSKVLRGRRDASWELSERIRRYLGFTRQHEDEIDCGLSNGKAATP